MKKPTSRIPPLIPQSVADEEARKRGIKIAPPDHPIYSEGPTIVLVSQMQGLPKPEEPEGEPADPAMVEGKGEEGSEQ